MRSGSDVNIHLSCCACACVARTHRDSAKLTFPGEKFYVVGCHECLGDLLPTCGVFKEIL